jgi:hypothetical protein
MKIGSFNIEDYLEKLYEEAEGGAVNNTKMPIIIPNTNKKSFDWLKKEYQKKQTEVKVEMKMGSTKFEPGYDLQTDLKSVKDFKPGNFGQVKTSDNEKKSEPKPNENPQGIQNNLQKSKTKEQPDNKNKKETGEKSEEKKKPEAKTEEKSKPADKKEIKSDTGVAAKPEAKKENKPEEKKGKTFKVNLKTKKEDAEK